ncbi:hypothetical protein SELMODRAFT_437421 [Selaginella moellendorffii]|uniref:Cyclin-like domain-containing protein n=1 Tax=Selaginella moellendorffii TaxID=88036 RepID=D8QQS5_SELML|nr:cyclin-T1-3 [Selaginella moellendorffii]XP_002967046.1 cyclin-T1-3 [Selaginella moellendorffii]EFJ31645.1 hypothetical protein SELMODRAFT_439903 [Selaginella moellendorffii]EFJ38500.1 hypothetical protein SELMODRAFT_437421 [Selaginella moellendorffii]|eukprot:XP_002960961.1 cyclin-T1-3 [Selaginella moellendorffii]
MTTWLFSKDELERKSPSLQDGMDARTEASYRGYYSTFAQELGKKLQVSQMTVATAITFCHRFYTRQSLLRNNCLIVATSCMLLATKVEETHRYLKEVVFISYELRNRDDPKALERIMEDRDLYVSEKQLVLYGERLVLTTIEFDLSVVNPHKPLVATLKRLRILKQDLVQRAWNFLNDGLRTTLVLQFKPGQVAAGAIYVAARLLKIKLPEEEGGRFWWHELDVTPVLLEEIASQLLEVYDNPSLLSPAEQRNGRSSRENGDAFTSSQTFS